nr:PREDICTED: uncharacterized protein LOC109041902 [Bemisia tabaci]
MLYLRCLIFTTFCLVMPFVHSEEPERKVHTEEECKKICEDREGWMVVPAQLDHHEAHISRRKSKDRGNHQTRIAHGRETDQSPRRINFTLARLSRQGEKCHCDLNAIEIRKFCAGKHSGNLGSGQNRWKSASLRKSGAKAILKVGDI